MAEVKPVLLADADDALFEADDLRQFTHLVVGALGGSVPLACLSECSLEHFLLVGMGVHVTSR